MALWLFLLLLFWGQRVSGQERVCKSTPESSSWPALAAWSAFNTSVSGRLLSPSLLAASCHPDHIEYNKETCKTIQRTWDRPEIHTDDPISMSFYGWNNASCLPDSSVPCDISASPAYVVNASNAIHVKATVDFVRENNLRLVVKSSGHDFLGRSTAPDAVSLWVKYLMDFELSDNFQPSGCAYPLNTTAVTVGGGMRMGDILKALDALGLATIAGTSPDVAIGGYVSGAGHSVLSPTYGLAADNVLEMEVVTADGSILVANECQNTDLFWALRGGGGSTFGVITKVTMGTFPTPSVGSLKITVLPPAAATSEYWDLMTRVFQAMPQLEELGVSGYVYVIPQGSLLGTLSLEKPVATIVLLSLHKSAYELLLDLQEILETQMEHLPWSTIRMISPGDYPSFYRWWLDNLDPTPAGKDWVVGSRLLNADSLHGNTDSLKETLEDLAGQWGIMACLTTGRGVWNAKPRGGSNSVSPMWRNETVVHFILAVTYEPTDVYMRSQALDSLDNRMVMLKNLAPYSGAYVNEAYAEEPNFQQVFWGDNYERLLNIKRSLDPGDVFWCHPCVGNERWQPVGRSLCQV